MLQFHMVKATENSKDRVGTKAGLILWSSISLSRKNAFNLMDRSNFLRASLYHGISWAAGWNWEDILFSLTSKLPELYDLLFIGHLFPNQCP